MLLTDCSQAKTIYLQLARDFILFTHYITMIKRIEFVFIFLCSPI